MIAADDKLPQRRIRVTRIIGAFLRRDWATAWSYRAPFIGDVIGSFSSLILFFFIGKLVDRADVEDPELAAGYFAFVVVGASVISIVEEGLSSYSSRVSSAQRTGTLETMAATPTPMWLTTFLGSFYDVLHASITSALTILVAVVVFRIDLHVTPSGAALGVVAVLASVLLFSSLGLLAAAVTFVFKRAGAFTSGIEIIVAAASGVWFPLDLLPGPLEFVARLLPFTWAVDVMREILLTGQTPVAETILLVVSAAVALPCSLWVTAKSVDHARRQGTLSYY